MLNFSYKCTECGREYLISPDLMVCPSCEAIQKANEPLRGTLEMAIEGHLPDGWDALDLLPVSREYYPDIPVGNTPLWAPARLRQLTGYNNLFLKDDTCEPTFSYKDRASFLVAAFCRQHGIHEVAVASTGNAAASMAGVGASAGLSITIFVPKNAPKAKLVQCLQYGSRLIPVDGIYDDAFDLSLKYTRKTKALNRNTAYNPLTIEGKKTAAIEIFRQLGKAPDYVFIPTGDGVILAGIYKGFHDLMQFGLIDKIPIMVAVQSSGSPNLCKAFEKGNFASPVPSKTVADSISVDVPRCGYLALKNLREYGGMCICVPDESILRAQLELSYNTGLFCEPAAASAYAGFLEGKEKFEIGKNACIVLMITGSGLKDIDAASKILPELPKPIKSLDDLVL
jgi:threonine synthase